MSLCSTIDTLAMAYLDDELAAEERRELDLHLTECAACKKHVEAERSELAHLRGRLAAPPAPDLLRAKVARALDLEDRAQRARWTRWILPGSSIMAAAAAIAVFVGINPAASQEVGAVAKDAMHQQTRALPLEVQGASTNAWLREHFEPQVDVPQVEGPDGQLLGARAISVNGHDAVLLLYRVNLGGTAFNLSVEMLRDMGDGDLQDGDEVRIGSRTLHVVTLKDRTMVTYVAANHVGYIFLAPDLSDNDLINLVAHTDLD